MEKFKEENTTQEPTQDEILVQDFIDILCNYWEPAECKEDADEFLTTYDLLEQIEGIADVKKNVLYKAMKDNGFKITYNGNLFFWMLSERLSD